MKYRVGFGYDIHRLVRGRPLILGGVEIPFRKGLAGHSDGDALMHAVIDALLGATAESDIGRLFPDTDPRYKAARSVDLLKTVMARMKRKKIKVVNVDCVIVAEEPKLAPYIDKMKAALTPQLGIKPDALGIQAKTNEGLGDIGKGRAIASWAVVLIA